MGPRRVCGAGMERVWSGYGEGMEQAPLGCPHPPPPMGGGNILMPLAVATLPPRVKELPAQGPARPRSLLLGLAFMSV